MFKFRILDNVRNLYKTRKKYGTKKKRVNSAGMNKKGIAFIYKIQTKLILTFFIPVILIILLGVISYQRSSSGLNQKYENAAVSNMDMLNKYLNQGFHIIESKAKILTSNNDIKRYYSGYYEKSTSDRMSTYQDIKTYIFSNVFSEAYIKNICIFGSSGDGITAEGSTKKLVYNEFDQSDLAKKIDESGKGMWIGYHSDLDDKLGNKSGGYSLSYINSFSYNLNNNKIGYIVLDVSKDYVADALSDMKLAEGSIAGYIINDEKK